MQTHVPPQHSNQQADPAQLRHDATKFLFEDNRPVTHSQVRLQSIASDGQPTGQLKSMQAMMAAHTNSRLQASKELTGATTAPTQADIVVQKKLVPRTWQLSKPMVQRKDTIQLKLEDALKYYNKITGENAKLKKDVDLAKLSIGQRRYFTRLENQVGLKSRKIGSSTGKTYRLDKPRQIRVRYGSTKARFARSERQERHEKGKYSGYNYATAKVTLTHKVNGKTMTVYITRGSQDGTTHSEGAIKDVIKLLQAQHVISVDWVYTEREACGPDNQNCRGANKLSDTSIFGQDVPIYYSVDWPDTAEKGAAAKDHRKKGTKLLKRIDTQVGKSTSIHDYQEKTDPAVHASEPFQEEDDGVVTSDDESSDESDILQGGYEGARKDYMELS